ncbi:MAG TPA: alpha/beta hydrolase [Spirochaetota bacterium]|nr:alpha/beta hydrolase [Spirochaetota bacterium]HPR49197.1 alpha/beta hydrolase [Spirochaetota bacterium]
MNTIVRIDPYSHNFFLKTVQLVSVALIKAGIRLFTFWAGARLYRLVRFLLNVMGFIFLRLPRWAQSEPVEVSGMPALWLNGKDIQATGTMLYVHGGGYSLGSQYTHRQIAACVGRYCHARVLLPLYPLAPEHPFPAAPEHALKAYQWLLAQGCAGEDISIIGDSSGGGLSLVLLQMIRDRGMPMPRCGMFLSPWTDLTCSGRSMKSRSCADPLLHKRLLLPFARLYAPESELSNSMVSPFFGSLKGLPRLLFMVGSDEVLLDDSVRILEKEADMPVTVEIWEGMFHVWPLLYAYVPFFKRAFMHIARFVNDGV